MNLYERLRVDRRATDVEIREAWRQHVRANHGGAGGDRETFLAAREAYETLSDPDRRRAYDAALDRPPQASPAPTPAVSVLDAERELEEVLGHPPTARQRLGARILRRVLDAADDLAGGPRRGRR